MQSFLGWREAFNAPAQAVQKLDTHGLPPQTFLGLAGMPGLTAYVGLLRLAEMKAGRRRVRYLRRGRLSRGAQSPVRSPKLKGHTVIACS